MGRGYRDKPKAFKIESKHRSDLLYMKKKHIEKSEEQKIKNHALIFLLCMLVTLKDSRKVHCQKS